MNKATFKTAQQLFEEAIDLPVEQRTSFVREKVSGDEVLYEVTCELLNNYEALPAYNDSLAEDAVMRVLADTDEPALPHEDVAGIAAKLPAFEILDKIGEGGMGGVYLAKRHGEGFEQTVAIKVLRDGLHSELARERFHQERQILAQLDHPAITRLIDGGSLDDDRPYLVMDYTPGLPITEFCEHNRLTVRQRLELFLKLTAAISHAHQNLVIHRDIKPPNILVGENGQPHLLDFGIAKLQDEEKLETRTGMMVLTPDYASPEQISGKPVTVASDVYALGVLLYELLSGSRPYNWRDHSPAEFEKLVYRSTPLPPSSVESEGFAPLRLTAELDNIVLKALHSDVLQRYHTVDELSADLQRLLNGEAVLAHPPGLIYRTRKFIGRHRLATAALGTIFVLISGFGTYSYLQSQELKIQRDQALQELRRAESLSGFLVDSFNAADPTRTLGEEVSASQILSASSDLIEESSDLDTETRTKIRLSLANAWVGLGQYEEAQELIESENRDLIDEQTRYELVRSLVEVLFELGQYDEAISLLDAEENLLSSFIDPWQQSELIGLRGRVLDKQDLPMEAQELNRQAYEMTQALLKVGDTPEHRDAHLNQCNRYGKSLWRTSDFEPAIALILDCLAEYQAENPAQDEWLISNNQFFLSTLYRANKQPEQSAVLLEKACQLREDIFDATHISLASCHLSEGNAAQRAGQYQQAIDAYERSIEIYNINFDNGTAATSTVLLNQGVSYWYLGDLDSAIERFEISRQGFHKHGKNQSQNLAIVSEYLARLMFGRDDYERARVYAEESIAIYEYLKFPQGTSLARVRVVLADTLAQTKQFNAAQTQLELAQPAIDEYLSNDEQLITRINNIKNMIRSKSS